MKAFVLDIDLQEFSASHIVGNYPDKYVAERAAQDYAKKFPNSTVSVYVWESGWTSSTTVVVDRQFYPPKMLTLPEPAPIVVVPSDPIDDIVEHSIEEVREML